MRPSKLKPHLITALREIVADEANMLICTDEELFFLLNDSLDWDDRVSYSSFKRYKARALEYMDNEALPEDIDPMYAQFYSIIRRATIMMKRNLMRNLMAAEKTDWMRYKWLMERKFTEFRPDKGKAPEAVEPLPVPQFRITTPAMPDWMATAIAEEEIRAEKQRQEELIAAEKERLVGEGALNHEEKTQRQQPAESQLEVPWQEIDKSLKASNGMPLYLIKQQEQEEAARQARWNGPDRPRAVGKIYGFY